MRSIGTFFLGIILFTLLEASTARSGPLEQTDHPHKDSVTAVHEASHGVDHAWEVYHRAALGGTVASPTLQAEIEEHLHDARTLITQAQEAAERGDKSQVDGLIEQVKLHTAQAIEGSKEQKR